MAGQGLGLSMRQVVRKLKNRLIRSRSNALVIMIPVLLLCSVAGVRFMQSSSAVTGQVFSPSSWTYQEIPHDAPRHPQSAEFVADIVEQMKQYYGSSTRMNVKMNTFDYTPPIYIANAGDPKVDFKFNNCQGKSATDTYRLKVENDYFKGVPLPPHAQQANGTDAELVVYSPSENKMWEFWIAEKTTTGWQACWGGRMDNVSQNPAMFEWPFGTTATGLPFLSGTATIKELQAGQINHAIGMALVRLKCTHSWPATRHDCANNGIVYEGLRFRLDPSVNVDALNISPVAKTVAKAIQKHGIVIWDKANAVTLRAENPSSYTDRGLVDPYKALYGDKADWNVLDGIPWDRLIALPHDYGKTSTGVPPPPPPAPATISQTSNLATGKTFVSSAGEVTGNEVYKVNDKDESSRWISNPADNTTLTTDLGTHYTLDKVSVLWAGNTTKNFDIQMSSDNVTWRTVASGVTNNMQAQLIDTTTFSASPSGRYLRVLAKDRWNIAYGNSIFEIGVYGSPITESPPPPPSASQISQTGNLATGKTFTASVPDSTGTPPANLNNGNEADRWISTPADNVTVTTDLGSSRTLSKVSVLWAGNTTKNYKIQMSANNSTWTTVASGTTNNTSPQAIHTTSFVTAPTGRYFRILAVDRWNTAYGHSIFELGIYGASAAEAMAGDTNSDNRVNAVDLSVVLSRDGQNYPAADFNKDGVVGAADMAILLGKWTW